MRRGQNPRGKRGFTLIEVIAALVIFSAGVLMVLGLSDVLSRRLSDAAFRTRVAVAVQGRLDSLRFVPYDSLAVETFSDTVILQGRTFNRTHRVLQTTPMVREVEVTIEAADGSGPGITSSAFVLRSW